MPLLIHCLSGEVLSNASRPAKILFSRVVRGVVGVITVADAGDMSEPSVSESCFTPIDTRRTFIGDPPAEELSDAPAFGLAPDISLTASGGDSGASSQEGKSRMLFSFGSRSPDMSSVDRAAAAARPILDVTRLKRFRSPRVWSRRLDRLSSGPSACSPEPDCLVASCSRSRVMS